MRIVGVDDMAKERNDVLAASVLLILRLIIKLDVYDYIWIGLGGYMILSVDGFFYIG